MRKLLPLLLLIISSSLYGQVSIEKRLVVEGVKDPVFSGDKLVVPADSKLVIKEAVRVSIDTTYKFFDILVTKDGVNLEQQQGVTELLFTDSGKYTVNIVLFDPDKGIKRVPETVVVVGNSPTPGPTPTPDPPPTPDTEKIDNISVLMLYESTLLPTYSSVKRNILHSTALRAYMTSTVSKDNTGFPNWRVLDQHTPFPATCDTVFCKWVATSKHTELPWLIIGNKDKIVFQGPLPDDEQVIKSLIEKYKR